MDKTVIASFQEDLCVGLVIGHIYNSTDISLVIVNGIHNISHLTGPFCVAQQASKETTNSRGQ